MDEQRGRLAGRRLRRASRRATVAATVITGSHFTLFAHDAEAARAFFRDVLRLESVDAGGGWLIFALPPAEAAFHPAEGEGRGELYLMCDDIDATLADLRGRGVEALDPVSDEGWGLLARIAVPGFGPIGLYEPRHASPTRS